ncbi:MAG: hypothetical protein RIQ52_2027 [Pseudomonadota bacterium]
MFSIRTYNAISPAGLARLPADAYQTGPDIDQPDAIMLRSFDLHGINLPESVLAVGRAGAGVNNIPVQSLTRRGIPVFNAPGANANAVAELVLAGMLMASRNLTEACAFTQALEGDDEALHHQIEKEKKRFAGFELHGRTLGVIGLGAIGVRVANAASALGMRVIGFDPLLTVDNARQLNRDIAHTPHLDRLLEQADFITLHIPLNEETRHFMGHERLAKLKTGAVLLNFSRGATVDVEQTILAMHAGRLKAYVTDFPDVRLISQPGSIVLPHLGASTVEAEDNCAIMVADQLRDFLETGNLRHAVNFPDIYLPLPGGSTMRLAIANDNIPGMVSRITSIIGENQLNILELVNKSRGNEAWTLIDVEGENQLEAALNAIRQVSGVLSARKIL